MSRRRFLPRAYGPRESSFRPRLAEAKFYGLHDRKKSPNPAMNVYRSSDDQWFLLLVTPDKVSALATGIGRPELLTDARFADPAKLVANAAQLTAILDEVFASQPMAHWREVFDHAHITFGEVKAPSEVINDPQLRANDIVVPLEGAGGKLTSTISSPMQVHGVAKVPAKRAPGHRRAQRGDSQAAGLQRERHRRLARERRHCGSKGTCGVALREIPGARRSRPNLDRTELHQADTGSRRWTRSLPNDPEASFAFN